MWAAVVTDQDARSCHARIIESRRSGGIRNPCPTGSGISRSSVSSSSADRVDQIATAMSKPAFYPDGPDRVEVRETHISWVFLTGERAFKLRKAVVFPFLDYGSSARRRHMCEEEVRLGRRLAPELYLGVRSVVARDGGFALSEAGDPDALEHLVAMRRFDEGHTLAARLVAGSVTEADVRAVARCVARFHSTAERAPPGSFGPPQVAATVSENFTTLLAFAGDIGDPRLAAAHRFAVAFLHGRHDQLAARADGGHVRDCHGDLRAEHVVFDEGGVQIFDPVEFDPALRLIDVGADLAFLEMELVDQGRADLARALVEAYRSAGGDDGGDSLLAFYSAYRAWVRAKVACLRAGELPDAEARQRGLQHARRLAALGERLSWRARGQLVLVVCGAAATGKTTLAEALAAVSGLVRLSSDVVRKELAGLTPAARAPAEEYSEEASLRTYRELGSRASAEAARGGAVVDATFRRRSHRGAFFAGFGEGLPRPLFVECRAPADVVVARARRREADPRRVSDASPEIAARQLAEFEPLDEVDPEQHVLTRTDRDVHAVVDAVEAALDARLAGGGMAVVCYE
jgi:aminoglycoside phosphotransferase family enzyme/predicted kinase